MKLDNKIIAEEMQTLNSNITIVKTKIINGCNKQKANQLLDLFSDIKKIFQNRDLMKIKMLVEQLPLLYIQINKI